MTAIVSYASPREPSDSLPLVARAGTDGQPIGGRSEAPRIKGERVEPRRIRTGRRCLRHGTALRGRAREGPNIPCPWCWSARPGTPRTYDPLAIIGLGAPESFMAELVLVFWFDRRPSLVWPYAASYGQELAWLLPPLDAEPPAPKDGPA